MQTKTGSALLLLFAGTVMAAPGARDAQQPGAWRSLLPDGKATGWRGYREKELPAGWAVVDGALTRVGEAADIIYAAEQFGDFELELEWKISQNGNSGIFFRATEETERIYHNAIEYQVMDNIGHPDNATEMTVAGSTYGLYPAPRDAVRPVGEWNTTRIVARGALVEHWLNGRKVTSYELGSTHWNTRVSETKFNQWPSFGRARRGFIGLQDHGDRVAYRGIRIRELP
jgi:hypothetical protein